ncbi:hypothetical protein HN680_06060 [Candidatus Peregrinibacteria bacterium]|jgi:hypothetical protein|nr:hypothetical protein [Candidatus Peregrinibacteria bacterium]
MRIRDKCGQQEIVGFVLIVVLVMVGMMVFLVISLGNNGEPLDSVEVSTNLDVLMRTTTECAITYEPDYDDFEDLFKSCYKEKSCSNLDRDACDYLNESLWDVMNGMMVSEAGIKDWSVDFLERDEDGEVGILRVEDWMNCTGKVNSAQRAIISGGDRLIVRMKVCMINN